jgi:hypothetical protein
MKKNLFFLLAALCSLQSFAAKKYYPATLIKIDGEKIECLVRGFKIEDTKLKYKETQKAKPVKIKCAELTRMIVHFDDGDVILDYVKYISGYNFSRGKHKVSKDRMWMQLAISGPCSLYATQLYKNTEYYLYAVKKQDEDIPSIIDGVSNKVLANYFSDCPELAEKIRAKKYRNDSDTVQFVNEYNLEKSIKK